MRMRLRIALVALVLAGCGQGTADTLGSEGTPPATPSGPAARLTKAQACPALEPEHLPAKVAVESAYVCSSDYRSVPGEGDWNYVIVRRVTGGLEELLGVYGADDAHSASGICSTELPDPLVVYLHGARTTAARAPLDGCSKPTGEARAAYDALTTVVVSETKESQGRSQLSIDTDCGDDWKDVLWVQEQDGARRAPTGTPQPYPEGTRVCRYEVQVDETGFRTGHLVSGEGLTAALRAEVNDELSKSRVDLTCSRHEHTRFAILREGQDDWSAVALDGCALMQGESWWRGTDRLRRLLSG